MPLMAIREYLFGRYINALPIGAAFPKSRYRRFSLCASRRRDDGRQTRYRLAFARYGDDLSVLDLLKKLAQASLGFVGLNFSHVVTAPIGDLAFPFSLSARRILFQPPARYLGSAGEPYVFEAGGVF